MSDLTFEQIEDCLPAGLTCNDRLQLVVSAEMLHQFARDIWKLKDQPTAAQAKNDSSPKPNMYYCICANCAAGNREDCRYLPKQKVIAPIVTDEMVKAAREAGSSFSAAYHLGLTGWEAEEFYDRAMRAALEAALARGNGGC